jgi:pantoate kinase
MGVIPKMVQPREERRIRRINAGMYAVSGAYVALVLAVAMSEAMGMGFMDQYVGAHLRDVLHSVTEPGDTVREFLNAVTNRI